MFRGAPMDILELRLQWPQLLAVYGQHCAVGVHDRRCWMHVAEGEGGTGARIMILNPALFKSRNKV